MWIAHKNEDGQREQSILEHLKGTANRAQEFANPFGCGEYGRCLGMLHDIGCRIAERTQIRAPGLNGQPGEPGKTPKTPQVQQKSVEANPKKKKKIAAQ